VRLAGDRALRLRFGAAAHAQFEQHFTIAAVKAVFIQLYLSMLAAQGWHRGPDSEAKPVGPQPIEG
jgi:hypothetical protein